MLTELKEEVLAANLELKKENLIIYTWGNVSGIDRDRGLVVIKPSGVPYEELRAEQMVVVDLSGKVVEGNLKPSSDTPTHLCLYQHFPKIGGVVHPIRPATAWAQAQKRFHAGHNPCRLFLRRSPRTRRLTAVEIKVTMS